MVKIRDRSFTNWSNVMIYTGPMDIYVCYVDALSRMRCLYQKKYLGFEKGFLSTLVSIAVASTWFVKTLQFRSLMLGVLLIRMNFITDCP